MVRILLNHKANVDQQNHKGTSPLWIASWNKYVDIVADLLSAGANPNLVNKKGVRCLAVSLFASLSVDCSRSHRQSAAVPGRAARRDDRGRSPARRQGGYESVREGARLACHHRVPHWPEQSVPAALLCFSCAQMAREQVLEQLLSRCSAEEAKEHLSTVAQIDGFNALLAAAEQERIECLKTCLKFGADMDFRTAPDNDILPGANALHLSAFYGARIAWSNWDLNSRPLVCGAGKYHALTALVNLNGSLLSKTSVHGWTPLHIGVKQGHPEVVR